MYAIVNISGKQYKVAEGSRVRVPRQVGDSGSTLTFNDILFISDGKNTHIGEPMLSGATVSAKILSHGRDRKIGPVVLELFGHKRANVLTYEGENIISITSSSYSVYSVLAIYTKQDPPMGNTEVPSSYLSPTFFR